jgi:hypothetical protein
LCCDTVGQPFCVAGRALLDMLCTGIERRGQQHEGLVAC